MCAWTLGLVRVCRLQTSGHVRNAAVKMRDARMFSSAEHDVKVPRKARIHLKWLIREYCLNDLHVL